MRLLNMIIRHLHRGTIQGALSIITFILLGIAHTAVALPVSHYADKSVLSTGSWVKISTTGQGVYRIDAATLRDWGFSDASRVCLYGKDGYMLPEVFSADDTDDLSQIPVYEDGGDIYFYASGNVQWQLTESGIWEHTNNYYSTTAYYFLTTGPEPLRMAVTDADAITAGLTPVTTFRERMLYENDLLCVGQTGRTYLGEDLLSSPSVSLHVPGITGSEMSMYVALAAKSSSSCSLLVSVNGTQLSPAITVAASDTYTYMREGRRLYTVPAAADVELTFGASGSGTLSNYYLDFIRLVYDRNFVLDSAQMQVRGGTDSDSYYAVDLAGRNAADVVVWNVDNAVAPHIMTTSLVDGKLAFIPENAYDEYIVFDKGAALHTPAYVGPVENQNLHGIDYIPDMVIVTTRYFMKNADRIADFHRTHDNMKVLVVDQLSVFNEFSGGTPDATAIRRLMKMFYDRAAAGYGNAPRYLLFLGRGSYNNRAIAGSMHNEDNVLLVTYQSENSTDSRYSYVTDDYFAFLTDDSGKNIDSDVMQVGVGRIPVKSIDEADGVYRKMMRYASCEPDRTLWKNKCCFIGFNGDSNLHIKQMDRVSERTVEADQKHMLVDKVFLSAYSSISSESFVGANDRIYNDLDEGTILYDYMGHANPQGIEGVMDVAKARSLTNEKLPVFITATCDVCPFDKDETSFGEVLFTNENGGFIALYTTTRTVYTNGNEDINEQLLHYFFLPGDDGKVRLGDVMRRAKEALCHNDEGARLSDPNKLKFCLIGDPALALPLPSCDIVVDSINGMPVDDDNIATLQANGEVVISGRVLTPEGKDATGFSGILCYEVYDAETTEVAEENASVVYEFDSRNYKLTFAADTIAGGRFRAAFRLPAQCLQSDGTGLISLYAYSNDKLTEAKGYCDDFVINGFTEAEPDETAPVIENMWLHSPSFSDGDAVPSTTVFHCDVADEESGIMLNDIAMGKGLTLWLDGAVLCSELSGYYRPALQYGSGSVDYRLEDLSVGSHVLTVRVADNAGNYAESSVAFVVEADATLQYDLTLDEDAVTDRVAMSLGGVLGDSMTVRYVIADAHTGVEVWSEQSASMQAVCDIAAAALAPGDYLCRAYIEVDGNYLVTADKKIVVLEQ